MTSTMRGIQSVSPGPLAHRRNCWRADRRTTFIAKYSRNSIEWARRWDRRAAKTLASGVLGADTLARRQGRALYPGRLTHSEWKVATTTQTLPPPPRKNSYQSCANANSSYSQLFDLGL
uniref:Uncharacterized protein n=1 Tax=Plectus sambesii TaxID=2011161 RepID=A0A914WF61_9BILA